jgi:hypothetical protein
MKIPIFDAFLNDKDLEGISCISIVDEPAMEKEMMVFEKQKKPIMFSVQDELQHKITSVVIRCNYPIYRIDEFGKEYYIRFGREIIDQLAEKYSKDGLLNRVSVQHNGELLSDIVMTEMYIKNTEKGINPVGFEDIEDYSLFATFKINNEDVWNRIVQGEFGGLSMEVMLDMKPTDEFVEEETDFWSELMSYLQEDEFELKKNFEADRNDILRAIDKGNPILIDEGGKKAKEYWVYQLGKKDGKDIVVLYDPSTKKWDVRTLKSIGEYIIGTDKIGPFDYSDPSYEEIIDDDDITISRTTHSMSISELIHNKVLTMISYNDEKEKPALGYRQCAIIAHGYTHTGAEAIRVMEVFGDSRSVKEGDGVIPDYRLLLTKRIKSLKILTGTAPWGWDVLDSRVNLTGDKSMFPCITHITKEDLDK